MDQEKRALISSQRPVPHVTVPPHDSSGRASTPAQEPHERNTTLWNSQLVQDIGQLTCLPILFSGKTGGLGSLLWNVNKCSLRVGRFLYYFFINLKWKTVSPQRQISLALWRALYLGLLFNHPLTQVPVLFAQKYYNIYGTFFYQQLCCPSWLSLFCIYLFKNQAVKVKFWVFSVT